MVSKAPASASAPADPESGPSKGRKNVAGEKNGWSRSAPPTGARTATHRSAARTAKRSDGRRGEGERQPRGDQDHPDREAAPAGEHALLGGALLRRDRLNAEEQAAPRGGRLFVVEDVHAVGRGAGRVHCEPDLGALAEQLRETASAVGDRGMGPDQHTGHGGAPVGGVAPRLEHDVISSGPRAERVAFGDRWETVAAGPGPRIALGIEQHDAHLGPARRAPAVRCNRSAAARSSRGAARAAWASRSAWCKACVEIAVQPSGRGLDPPLALLRPAGLDRRQACLRDGDRRDQPHEHSGEAPASPAGPGGERHQARYDGHRADHHPRERGPPQPFGGRDHARQCPRPATTADDDSTRTPLAHEGNDSRRDREICWPAGPRSSCRSAPPSSTDPTCRSAATRSSSSASPTISRPPSPCCGHRRSSTGCTPVSRPQPGGAALRRRTLHRVMNELIESWEEGAGVREFVILTAQASEAHLEALSTIRTEEATVQVMDIFGLDFGPLLDQPAGADPGRRARHLAAALPRAGAGRAWSWRRISRSRPRCSRATGPGTAGGCREGSPGSVGYPSLASAQKGELLYRFILDRISSCLAGT